jgi:hypothetical protein
MLRCVIGVEVFDVSKYRTAFIFRDTQLLRSYFAANFEVCTAVFLEDQGLLATGVMSLGKCFPTFRYNAVEGTT